MRVDPKRGLDSTAAVLCTCMQWSADASGHDLDEARGEQHPGFIDTDIAGTLRSCLCQLADHHQFRERRNTSAAPDVLALTERFHQLSRQLKRQTLVAASMMVVGA